MSKKEEFKFLRNGKRLVEEKYLNVCLYEGEIIKGLFIVFEDGSLFIVDTRSMLEKSRTKSYLVSSKNIHIYNWLNEKLETKK